MALQPSPLLRGFEQGADGEDVWNRMMPGEERGPLTLDPQGVALGQQFAAIKAGIEAQQARPIWNPDNRVGEESLQSMGMPGPTTYAGPVGQFIDPATGRMTEQGATRMQNPMLGLDTGGLGMIKAFHGSPHAFDAFSDHAIGTGEGAQAYGYGHYLAENEGVARGYRDALTPQPSIAENMTINGKTLAEQLPPDTGPVVRQLIAGGIAKHGGDVGAALDDWIARSGQLSNMAARAAEHLRGAEVILPKPAGHMYEVNVAADPEKFLHWDKPLNQQHPDVRAAVRASIGNAQPVQLRDGNFSITHVQPDGSGRVLWDISEKSPEAAQQMYGKWLDTSSGREIYQHISRGLDTTPGNESPAASQALKEAGIPGIRYLDQSSRGAGSWTLTHPERTVNGKWLLSSSDGNNAAKYFDNEAEARAALAQRNIEPTHNVVVFDPSTMEIIRRYGLAGLMGGGAAALAGGGNQEQ